MTTIEYLRNKKVTYDSVELPFGPGNQARTAYAAFELLVSRIW